MYTIVIHCCRYWWWCVAIQMINGAVFICLVSPSRIYKEKERRKKQLCRQMSIVHNELIIISLCVNYHAFDKPTLNTFCAYDRIGFQSKHHPMISFYYVSFHLCSVPLHLLYFCSKLQRHFFGKKTKIKSIIK